MGTDANTPLLVWDRPGRAPADAESCVLWRAFPEPGEPGERARSIPMHLEANAARLRARFLEWIHDLGHGRAGAGTVIERLALRSTFSLWWMSLLVEKSNAFNSPQIVNALKLFAFEDLVGRGCGRVTLESADRLLARAMRGWCVNSGCEFEWRRTAAPEAGPRGLRGALQCLPYLAQGLVRFARRLKLRGVLRGTGSESIAKTHADITFCSYLFNLDKRAAAEGRLGDSYWTDLHGVLARDGVGANWIFQIIEHEFVADAARGRALIESFNASGRGAHVPLDSALDARIAWRALGDYLRLWWCALGLRAPPRFRPRDSALDLWPLFERDWRDSLSGAAAMSSCIDFNLIEAILGRLPRQRMGFYLQENIGWEMAFVHCWQTAGHGKLVGVPHSTVRFWDLRYFNDPREFARVPGAMPLPDLVALNGPAARVAYLEGGFPAERLCEVEALRYLHLASAAPRRSSGESPLRVLVLGDYMPLPTAQQMRWLTAAARQLPEDTVYVVKPHPACPVRAMDYPELSFSVTDLTLDKVLGDFDVAFTSNMTSAAVDASSFGVRVVSVLDGEMFNISPLRGTDAVTYVTNPDELAAALRKAGVANGKARPFFHLDRGLPRWRKLLGLREAS